MTTTQVLNDDGSVMTLEQAEAIVAYDGYGAPYIDFNSADTVILDGEFGHRMLKALLVVMEHKMLKA
jgi:hypothetical protein